jgi:ribose transport system permease protein
MAVGPSSRRQPNEEASTALGLVLLIVLAFMVFSWAATGFSSPYNLYALTRTAALNVLLGLAMMVVIATGGLDLSIGAIGIASAMFAGYLMQDFRVQMVIAIVGALSIGGALGVCNGFVIVFARVHSFIVTLASMSIIFGAMIVLTKAESVRDLPAAFLVLGRVRWFGCLSPMLVVSAGIGAVIAIMLRWTDLGREILASGANSRAATLSGVRVGKSHHHGPRSFRHPGRDCRHHVVHSQWSNGAVDGRKSRPGMAAPNLLGPCWAARFLAEVEPGW